MAPTRSSAGLVVAAALAAAALGGCGSGNESDQVSEPEEVRADARRQVQQEERLSRSPASSAPRATSAPVAPARPGVAAGASSGPSCENLRVTSDVRITLRRVHERSLRSSGATHDDGPIAKGSVYYGRCGSTHYAIATFSKAIADQPEKFRRLAGRPWVDEGDGFESGCGSARKPIPRALVRLWRFCATEG